jgi:hypothetical protein
MAYTSFGTRKALGRRYSQDPALLLEAERLQQEYGLMPGREARALQAQGLAQQQSQFDTQQANAKTAGMVGTASNLAQTGVIVRGMTMKPGDKFWGNWGSPATTEVPTGVMQGTTPYQGITSANNPSFWTGPSSTTQGAGYAGNASGMAGTTPMTGGGVPAVNPALVDSTNQGIGAAGASTAAGAAYGSQGGIGTGIGAMESGIGAMGSYLGPVAAGYSGPKMLEQAMPGANENLGHNLSLGLLKGEKDASTLGRTASGAAAGAAIGSMFGGVGAGPGAVVGGVVGFLSSVFGW